MSDRMTALVWERSKAQGTSLLILLRFAQWADEQRTDTCWAATSALAARLNLQQRMIRYAIKWLVTNKEITVERGAGPGGTNHYRITLAAFPVEHPAAIDCSGGVQSVAGGGGTTVQHPGNVLQQGTAIDCSPSRQHIAGGSAAHCRPPVQSVAEPPAMQCSPEDKEKEEAKEREGARERIKTLSEEFFVIDEENPEPVETAASAFEALGGSFECFPKDWPAALAGLSPGDVRAICALADEGIVPRRPSDFWSLRTRWKNGRQAADVQRALADEADRKAEAAAAQRERELAKQRALIAEIDGRPDLLQRVRADAVANLGLIELRRATDAGKVDGATLYTLTPMVERLRQSTAPALRLVGAL